MEDSMKPNNNSLHTVKSIRSCKQAMTSWRQTVSKEREVIEPVAWWGQGFVGPVPVAVTTVRLVREAKIELRRLCLHLMALELRTPSPRPITLISLQGRLPNLHRLHSPMIHNDTWMLRTRHLTSCRIQSSSVTSLQVTQIERLQWCLTLFGSRCFGLCPRKDFSLSQMLRGGLLSNDKSCAQTLSSHQFMV